MISCLMYFRNVPQSFRPEGGTASCSSNLREILLHRTLDCLKLFAIVIQSNLSSSILMMLMAIDTQPRIVDGVTDVFVSWDDPTIKLATPLRAIEIFTVIDMPVERTEYREYASVFIHSNDLDWSHQLASIVSIAGVHCRPGAVSGSSFADSDII